MVLFEDDSVHRDLHLLYAGGEGVYVDTERTRS